MDGINLSTGFEHHFRPAESRVRAALEQGLIVLDTNILLNVLRYSPQARAELIEVLASIANRSFIPHQVALEYNRKRVSVVAERQQEILGILDEITSIREKIRTVVNSLTNRRTLSVTGVKELKEAAETFSASLEAAGAEATAQYDLDPNSMVGARDEWTRRLEEIFEGRVGVAPPPDVFEADRLEGERRKTNKIAPGFKDSEPGDYLWWAEALRHPDLPGKALLVISDDSAKGDWRFEERGLPIGPHPALIDDVRRAGGEDLVLLTTRDLLALIEKQSPERVSEGTVAESEDVLSSRQTGWTLRTYEVLLATLEREGFADRAEVVRVAALQSGFIGRDHVYNIIGVTEEARSLRHFATPVQRIMRDMISKGLLSERAPDALRAVYEGVGKTIGYATPAEFPLFEDALSEMVVDDQMSAESEGRNRP